MSFYNVYEKLKDQPFKSLFDEITASDVENVLQKDGLTEADYFTLLSPAAEGYLEEMAQKAHQLTLQHFGYTMQLFLPLYVSDYCVNTCKYCSFSVDNVFPRRRLTMEEVEEEAQAIYAMGIEQIIILSGESRVHSSVDYLSKIMKILRKYFSSVGLEVQPMDREEYEELVESGIDTLTVFQETYDQEIYRDLHTKGPKRFYKYRLDTPERGCQAGMRSVTIGALLGLDDWRKESYITGLHGSYLQDNYLDTEIGISFPRVQPNAGSFQPEIHVTDQNMVQAMLALRLFLPRAGIILSTRETPQLRDQLIPLGVTKMSAASSTEVGGYTQPENTQSQFEISDERSVEEVRQLLHEKGYQPVMKDWQIV
ncbi:2-iminoacetate synthase ThiH [Halobacillus shinanisalinarum]|uniref:2-iminoacetate synthase ThiH n=1 Tax=Halobacillus shinanisalinarum TaxID=2932258 RepID=A0ABY4GUP7_9BACI|nr:2-iminoacetate synthase ThiH [Halobacillus shinanisalinarum]UOQ91623.1 2-iminoacetate synthase ThiH [Halobacillus shinanisalinarum]